MRDGTRGRIPFLVELVDSCRLLPQDSQLLPIGIIYVLVQIVPAFFSVSFFYWSILILEILFLLIIIQKYLVYKKISELDFAIRRGVFWLKTDKEEKRKVRYLLRGSLFFIIMIVIHFFLNEKGEVYLIHICFLGVFSILKGVFYVPVISLKYNYDERILIYSNEYKRENDSIDSNDFTRIEIKKDRLQFFDQEGRENYSMEIEFPEPPDENLLDDTELEKNRLLQFLNGILKHKRVVIKD